MSKMDIDSGMVSMAPSVATKGATVLCHNCGAPIDGTTSTNTLCYDCVKLTFDVTQGIPREAVLHLCRDCDRWLLPPSSWVVAAPESKELLSVCLRKLRGLGKVRLTDAVFIWTEPHSRRVKVKLTVQDAVADGVLLQQSFEVVYVVHYQQCPECAKSWTHNVWRSSVQVRQHVRHKRTFLYLEQLILKHGAHKNTINIKESYQGLDFFFSQVNDASAFVDFLKSVVPVNVKSSKQIISEDSHTAKKSYKFTFSAEIVPVCKDDLVALPLSMAKSLGNISPLVLCHRIGTSVNLLDPATLQTADVSSDVYWRAPFKPLADAPDMVEFVVLDVERSVHSSGKWVLAEATIARASDMGSNDKTYFTRTHLGSILHPGDSVMGYMLTGSNWNNTQMDAIESSRAWGSTVPDVVLVKKHFPNRRRNRRRNWKLRRMARDDGELLPKKVDQDRQEAEYEMFLRDVEEDEELRAALALYKNTNKKKKKAQQREAADADAMSVADTDMDAGDEDDEVPGINMDELLDDFDELDIEDHEDGGGAI